MTKRVCRYCNQVIWKFDAGYIWFSGADGADCPGDPNPNATHMPAVKERTTAP